MRKSTHKKMQANREAYLVQQQQEALQKDIFLSSMHEAGHALAYTLLSLGVEYVTVERKTVEHNGQQMMSSGFTQPLPRPFSKETIENEAVCVLAGPAAEDRFNGHADSGSAGDVDNLRNYALSLGLSQDEAVDLTGRAYRLACALVDEHIDAVKKIAFELMTKGRIEGETVRTIVEQVKVPGKN
jgi:ATP-dependent Zn protease